MEEISNQKFIINKGRTVIVTTQHNLLVNNLQMVYNSCS